MLTGLIPKGRITFYDTRSRRMNWLAALCTCKDKNEHRDTHRKASFLSSSTWKYSESLHFDILLLSPRKIFSVNVPLSQINKNKRKGHKVEPLWKKNIFNWLQLNWNDGGWKATYRSLWSGCPWSFNSSTGSNCSRAIWKVLCADLETRNKRQDVPWST